MGCRSGCLAFSEDGFLMLRRVATMSSTSKSQLYNYWIVRRRSAMRSGKLQQDEITTKYLPWLPDTTTILFSFSTEVA